MKTFSGLVIAVVLTLPLTAGLPIAQATSSPDVDQLPPMHTLGADSRADRPPTYDELLRYESSAPQPDAPIHAASLTDARSGPDGVRRNVAHVPCEEAWGDGPTYGEGGYDWLWVAQSRTSACSLWPLIAGSASHNGLMVAYADTEATVTPVPGTKKLVLDMSWGNFLPLYDGGIFMPDHDTVTIDVVCLSPTDEVQCTTSDGDGETRTVAAWANSGINVEVDLSESSGFGDEGTGVSALYVRTSLTNLNGTTPKWVPPLQEMLTFRCDHASYAPGAAGCVFHQWEPEIVFDASASSNHTASALHYRDALHAPERTVNDTGGNTTPLRGRKDLGEPLTRRYPYTSTRTRVRNVCIAHFPDYPGNGLQCDEYPFASTYQGADFSDHFSARALPGNDNMSSGALLGAFYNGQRLLDGDDFYVGVTGAGPHPGDLFVDVTAARSGECGFDPLLGVISWKDPGELGAYYCYKDLTTEATTTGWADHDAPVLGVAIEQRRGGSVIETIHEEVVDCAAGQCGTDHTTTLVTRRDASTEGVTRCATATVRTGPNSDLQRSQQRCLVLTPSTPILTR